VILGCDGGLGEVRRSPSVAERSTVTAWRPHGLAVLGRHTREVTCVKRGLSADVRATRVRVIVDVAAERGADPRVAQAEAYRLAAAVCDLVAEAEGWIAADPVVRMLERGARVTVTGHDAAAMVSRFFEGAADAALEPRAPRPRPRPSMKEKALRPLVEPAGAIGPLAL
jgi:sirohydrochlorin ferrochelatase